MIELPYIKEMVERAALDELRAFDHVRVGVWAQNTRDWTDPKTNVFYPATFDYYSYILGNRRSDSVDFAVSLRLDHHILDTTVDKLQRAYVESVIVGGIFSLADFSECDCKVGAECQRHKGRQ